MAAPFFSNTVPEPCSLLVAATESSAQEESSVPFSSAAKHDIGTRSGIAKRWTTA